MGRHSKDDAQRLGPRLWARFLKRHFACSRMAPLNAQLLLPVTPFEVFEFGENPAPLPEKLAPKLFDRAYDLGRSPDGLYTPEIYDPDSKFNLYERVTQRVPESKYWLLKELDHFLRPDPPSIDASLQVLRGLLTDLKLVFPERFAVASWNRINEVSLANAERATFDALGKSPLPECLALTYSLGHLSVWRGAPPTMNSLPDRLLRLGFDASRSFAFSLDSHEFDHGHEIGIALANSLSVSRRVIERYGARCMSFDNVGKPPDLARNLVLVPDTVANRKAILCLSEATELHAFEQDPWIRPGPEPLLEFMEKRPNPRTTGLMPSDAAMQLEEAALQVIQQLRTRASQILDGYKGVWSRPQAPAPNKPLSGR